MTTTESGPATRGRTSTADRVPIPTRQRRPALAAMAVLLILGGAALSGYLAITSGDKTSVLAMARDVQDGQPITAADLTTVSVSAPAVNTIPASQLRDVVNSHFRAKGTYPRGMILISGMLRGFEVPGDGYLSMAVLIPEGQFPPQTIAPGSAVRAIYTPKGNATTASGQPTIPGLNPGDTLVDSAQVISAKVANNGGGIFTIVVSDQTGPNALLPKLVQANATGSITLLKLPDSVHPQTGG